MKNKKIILIDGNNLAYRAYYALPESIATSSGTVTNAVYGFTSMLIKLIEERKPNTVVCAFDSKVPTFRHEMFEAYKAQRKKMPSELSNQISLIKGVLSAFNILFLELEGYEADDILAAIAKSVEKKFKEIIIVTGDKDVLQLVSDRIKVMAVKKGITDTVLFDKKGVKEKFGVNPERIKDLLALMGDSSDNIPGIPGIGPKTARNLLEKYGSIENIYKNIDRIKSVKTKRLLINYKHQAEISKKLTELVLDIDINIDEILSRSFKHVDYSKIEKLFSSLEFKTLMERVKKLGIFDKFNKDKAKAEYTSKSDSIFKVKEIELKPLTNSLDFEKMCKDTNDKVYITLAAGNFYKNTVPGDNLTEGIILYPGKDIAYFISNDVLAGGTLKERVRILLEDEKISKSGFDFKNIYKFLKKYGIELRGRFIDYKIMYLILNSFKTDTDIKEVIKDMLDLDIKDLKRSKENLEKDFNHAFAEDYKKVASKPVKESQMKLDFDSNDGEDIEKIEDIFNYGRKFEPILLIIGLYSRLEDTIIKKLEDEGLSKIYFDIEGPLIKVLAEMEFTGVNIDKEYLTRLIKKYNLHIKKLKEEIFLLCGEKFNINSTQQLSNILYRKLELPALKKTKTGFSTDASTLISIYNTHPVIEKILDYREKVKLKNTYIDVLPNLIDPRDGRVHTTYNQLGTATGRISSSDPNLQNIPVRTELGRQIRKAFIPGNNYDLLLTADYSQIELRILAHLSEDEDLLDSFNRGEDIHTRTASEIFNVSYEEVDEMLRRKAKAINFGIIYGMTEYGLKSRLSISEEEAREYIKMYFERYPKVKKYINYLIDTAYRTGYTTTIFGRKRYINELSSSNVRLRNLGERLAVNTPIQGSAADIMKLSTVILYNDLKSNNIDCNIIMQVHDELVLELKDSDLDKIKKIVLNSMENCIKLKVKLKVDIKVGKNWYI